MLQRFGVKGRRFFAGCESLGRVRKVALFMELKSEVGKESIHLAGGAAGRRC